MTSTALLIFCNYYLENARLNADKISSVLGDHYRQKFLEYGATSRGVDWGGNDWAAVLRQNNMLGLIEDPVKKKSSILDVGCGYGALADIIKEKQLNLTYTGIDIVGEMIAEAKNRHPSNTFICGDFMKTELAQYDYVICNGILTQKLTTSTLSMNHFANKLIKKMFSVCKQGVAFNIMTTFVNFQKDNLYYRNPAELMAWCMSELTPHVKIDCAYELWYEYTVYLYKRSKNESQDND